MEPTIYKPGSYNTPGVYNGAGGIYKGRGVYNMGIGTDPNIIYEFNLDRFDISTLKDGDRQWIDTSNRLTFTKETDCLAINFTSGTKQWFSLRVPEFSTLEKFRVRAKYGGSLPWNSFMGFAEYSLWGRNGQIYGFWKCLNNNWQSAYSATINAPNTFDLVFRKNGSKFNIDVTRNGTYYGTDTCDHLYDTIHHNVDYGGNSNNGTIKLYELLITKE